MNVDELQSVQSRERQASSLQHLRGSFYEEAGEYIGELRAERDQRAAASDNPFDDEEIERLTDEIRTAERTVESIYERRVGKVVKLASIAAAGMPCDDGGLTTEEERLFEALVDRIERNRESVLAVLDGEAPPLDCTPADGADAPDAATGSGQPGGTEAPSAAREGTTAPGEAGPSGGPDRVESRDDPDTDAVADRGPGTVPDPAADTAPHGDVGGDGSGPSPPDDPLDVDAEPATAGTEPGAAETGGPASGESFDLGSAMGESGGGADEGGSGPAPRDKRGEAAPAGGAETAVTGQGGASAGGQGDASTPVGVSPDTDPAADEPIERTTVRVTADVGGIYGVDGRSYDLSAEDVVTLPTPNAENLVSKRAAERLD